MTEYEDSESQAFLHNSTSTSPASGPSTSHASHGNMRVDEHEPDSMNATFNNECEVSRILLSFNIYLSVSVTYLVWMVL